MSSNVPFDNTTPWRQPKCVHGNYAITCYQCYTGSVRKSDASIQSGQGEKVDNEKV